VADHFEALEQVWVERFEGWARIRAGSRLFGGDLGDSAFDRRRAVGCIRCSIGSTSRAICCGRQPGG